MKVLYSFTLLISNIFFSQKKLTKDIDFDGTKDTIYIDSENTKIVSLLSTQNFKKVKSGEIESLDGESSLKSISNGFELHIDWMRAGYCCQFRYNKIEKKIQLIGMNRYEFGPASNDGSGESSVNLLTGQYIGNWNYYDLKKEELIKIPTIKSKMIFPKIYLENFSEKIYLDYSEKCSSLYIKRKNKLQNK